MSQPSVDAGLLAAIAEANAAGWAIEFQTNPTGGNKMPFRCIFRRYGTIGDATSICRAAGSQTDAFNAAQTAWQSFVKWEGANIAS